jgi:mannose-6-phosphate isomerase-like protein (cupin superfamily)
MSFATRKLATAADVMAPDGSEVRLLAATVRGSMAHFRLLPGQVSLPVVHRTVEEVWFVVSGRGLMWRKLAEDEQVTTLEPGLSLSLPAGTAFQFRCDGDEPLDCVGVTMPPWPGMDEAMPAAGHWPLPTPAIGH